MTALELASTLRTAWVRRVSHALARGASVRDTFGEQLERFYGLLEHALETGDPAWLDPILTDWCNSQTLPQMKNGGDTVSKLLNEMILITNATAREILGESDALDLITALTPLHMYALEKVARLETETRVLHVTSELAEIQQKLEQLDKTKSNFISVAAHELKTPLTLIEGYTSMMRDSIAQADHGRMDPLLQGVNTGIRRLRQIVDDMIDVSLIDNHLLSLNLQPLRLSYVIGLLKSELGQALKERQLALVIQDFPESEDWLYADNERIYQALQNILINAIKYTPNRGAITISRRSLPGFVEIKIADTGIGISPEHQEIIFGKFGQLGRVDLHSSGKIKFKGGGPGLGLSITRGIIEAHGGTIWVESEGHDEEKCPGSTFHILLPNHVEPTDERLEKLLASSQ